MRAPQAPRAVPTRRRRGASRLTMLIVIVVSAIGLALAVPRLIRSGVESARVPGSAPRATVVAPKPVGVAAVAPVVPSPAPSKSPADKPKRPGFALKARDPGAPDSGDLEIDLRLRWDSIVAGAALPATVEVLNGCSGPVHLPAPGEPHPTLSLVVLNAEGHEVRRVVESGADPYPRRTTAVAPGASIELQSLVLSGDDAPLAPGAYTVYAELRRDPAWARLGIPMWRAPNGPVRSAQQTLTVVAKSE